MEHIKQKIDFTCIFQFPLNYTELNMNEMNPLRFHFTKRVDFAKSRKNHLYKNSLWYAALTDTQFNGRTSMLFIILDTNQQSN